MKIKKKAIIIIIIGVILLGIGSFSYWYFSNTNRLTLFEKEWIRDNENAVMNVGVLNDVNVFGKDGAGVFFDYLRDFSNEYGFTINTTPYLYGKNQAGMSFEAKDVLEEKDILLYEDHYVIVGKENTIVSNVAAIADNKIATTTEHVEQIKKYYPSLNVVSVESKSSLINELQINEEVNYIIVPLNIYLDLILSNDLYILYHVSDIPMYYTLSYEEDNNLSSIAKKFANVWIEEKFDKYYNAHNLDMFILSLGIQEKEKDILTSKVYYYGLIKSPAFELMSSNSLTGVIGTYINKFSAFSNMEFKYTSYKNSKSLLKAIDKGQIDLYFNYYNIASNFTDIKTNYNPTLAIITQDDNTIVINSVNSLRNKTVYVLENSNIYYYMKNLNSMELETYSSEKELSKLKNKDVIIVMDIESFNYYSEHDLKSFTLKYSEKINSPFYFKINGDATFQKLFAKYINSLDSNLLSYEGINKYSAARDKGFALTRLAIYALVIIGAGALVVTLTLRSKNKVKLTKKIKKEDKMRFIDMLTSLKNRNYLSENIDGWNKNNVYPQAAVIVDLNRIKYINDTHGSAEGDKQIKAAANILIKTQIDNTDIIRTDGNEYLIYMIGFEEKRVVSYIRKLYKELNNLPYEYGAAIGYSLRTNEMKTIEDVINEATIDMRKKKDNKE